MKPNTTTSDKLKNMPNRNELLSREWAPCRWACPAHVDVRGYLELIARGRFAEALDLIREDLPFPSVCGRICHHPCEQDCRRGDLDEPAAIRDLKRFVAERDYPDSVGAKAAPGEGERVAVIGAGPSGLTAALDLARAGYRATVFEREPVAGGMLAMAVPRYRLPREVLNKDIGRILAAGVELRTGVEVGRDVTLDGLRGEGFRAIVIAAGLAKSRALPIPGADAGGVSLALPFLKEAAYEGQAKAGRDVVVIGGGNVAVDVARTAIRAGASRVRMVCLESAEEQPAWRWETGEALEEGISTLYRRGPRAILTEDGRVSGIELRGVTRVFDEQGRFSPEYDDADIVKLDCDGVIVAVGQASDCSFASATDVAVDAGGRLVYRAQTSRTSAEDVFACGEVVTGPGSAIDAVASGHRAARAVEQFLKGLPVAPDLVIPPKVEPLPPESREKILRVERPKPRKADPAERVRNFGEVEFALTEEEALAAARSCMSCGAGAVVVEDKCAACQTCARVCPFDVPKVRAVAEIHSCLCQGCGICAAECPANAIVMAGYPDGETRRLAADEVNAIDGSGVRLVVFASGHRAPAALWGGGLRGKAPGVAFVYLPILSRLSALDIVTAFEDGADGVLVLAERSGTDRYPGVDERLRKRAALAAETLKGAGIRGERIEIVEDAASSADAAIEAARNMTERLRGLGRAFGRPPEGMQ